MKSKKYWTYLFTTDCIKFIYYTITKLQRGIGLGLKHLSNFRKSWSSKVPVCAWELKPKILIFN